MKRTIKKQLWLNKEEAQELAAKAKKTCLSEAGLIRMLLKGFNPKEKPDDRFYDCMRQLSAMGNCVNQIAVKANGLGFVDAVMLEKEVKRWHAFQNQIEKEFLRPEHDERKWQ